MLVNFLALKAPLWFVLVACAWAGLIQGGLLGILKRIENLESSK